MDTSVMAPNTALVVASLTSQLAVIEKQIVSTLTDRPEGLPFIKMTSQYDAQGVITAKATLTSEGITVDIAFVHENVINDASEIAQRFIFESIFAMHVQRFAQSTGLA